MNSILHRAAALGRYQQKIGTIAGTKWFALRALNMANLLPRSQISVRSPTLIHPVILRPGTSDFDVFTQVVLWEDYDFLEQLSDIRIAVDLGANIGLASATILSQFPNCKVLAVEPDPENCSVTRKNLAAYGPRARVLEGAVWSEDGEVALNKSFGDRREWAVAVKRGDGIKAYSMASIFSHFGDDPIDLLKMDIEGTELELFRGDTSWLSRVRHLCVEFHGAACIAAFRNGTKGYRWRESMFGEYLVCLDIELL